MEDKAYLIVDLDIPEWEGILPMVPKGMVLAEEGYGLEREPHLTLLSGVQPNIGVDKPKKIIQSAMNGPLCGYLTGISVFENAGFNVVKFDVFSPMAHFIHQLCRMLPHENDYPAYNPHVTLFYAKMGYGHDFECTFSKPHYFETAKFYMSYPDGSRKYFQLTD